MPSSTTTALLCLAVAAEALVLAPPRPGLLGVGATTGPAPTRASEALLMQDGAQKEWPDFSSPLEPLDYGIIAILGVGFLLVLSGLFTDFPV